MAAKDRIPSNSDDEVRLFTEEEYRRAYAFILPDNEARALARQLLSPDANDPKDAEWQISSDLLDLLSLVSEDCASRVAEMLRLSPEAAAERRLSFVRFHRISWP